jgi:hypothetical protein
MADTPATERSFYNLPCQMSSSSLRVIGTYNGSYTALRCIAMYIPQCAHQRTGVYIHTYTHACKHYRRTRAQLTQAKKPVVS